MSEVSPVFHQIANRGRETRGYEGAATMDSTLLKEGHFPAKEINNRRWNPDKKEWEVIGRGRIARARRSGLMVFVAPMQ